MQTKSQFIKLTLFVLSLCFFSNLFAVSEAGALFLLISPSAAANSMGQTYGTLSGFDPMASIFNPAALGLFVQKNYLGHTYYPNKVSWLPQLVDDMTYNARATSVGMSLQKWIGFPLYFGLSHYVIKLDFGEQLQTGPDGPQPIGSFSSWDEVKGTMIALSFDRYVRGSIGFTLKHIESHLASYGSGTGGIAEINASDFGVLVEVPLLDLLRLNARNFQENINIRRFFDPGLYYSVTNIGDKIKYTDASQADLLPRNLTLGFNVHTGLTLQKGETSLKLFAYKWAREVSDLLIKHDDLFKHDYATGLNEIQIGKHLLQGEVDESVISKSGHEFNLLDFYFKRWGKYMDMEGLVVYETEGWGVDFIQPLRILSAFISYDNTVLKFISANLHIEMHQSEFNIEQGHPLFDTSFKSYVVRMNNIFELF